MTIFIRFLRLDLVQPLCQHVFSSLQGAKPEEEQVAGAHVGQYFAHAMTDQP
jgi:hypothetical protein